MKFHEEDTRLNQCQTPTPPYDTERNRLVMEREQLTARIARINEALEIMIRNPDIERLLKSALIRYRSL